MWNGELILAGMATYNSPERLETLPGVLASIVPQVDTLALWWNGPGEVPAWIGEMFPPVQVMGHSGCLDYADMGKIVGLTVLLALESAAYVCVVDDDIIYPTDYVEHLVAAIDAYARKAIVGYHGIRLLHVPVHSSYYHERAIFHANDAAPQDCAAHMLGTGTTAWHSATLNLAEAPSAAAGRYMADIWLGHLAQSQHVPMVCLAHPARHLRMLLHRETIFSQFSHDDPQQAAYVNSGPWELLPLPPKGCV